MSKSGDDKEFWDNFLDSLKYTRQLVKKHTASKPKTYEVYPSALREKMKREKAAQHDCTQLSDEYLKMVDQWLVNQKEFIQSIRHLTTSNHAAIDEKTAMLKDCIEVIKWYQPQIYVKLSKAVFVMMHENEDGKYDYEAQNRESDGTAKVAIIAIERSIAAWGNMMERTKWQEDECLEVLVLLDKLLKSVEHHFPDARAFIRPGFDE
ncbi:MAG: hypothetical protein GVY19_06315 [Bacteroidetes bacterium]|jgi:hypothetical protein|nr:hypothetical protein [Bacteroidota bacterium]